MSASTKKEQTCTFFGVNTLINRKVAIKFYCFEEQQDFPEPQRLAELQNPSILKIHDAAPVSSDYAYFSTEFCEKGDLDDFLKRGSTAPRMALDATIDILSGVSYLHSKSYAHRDLKPSNIFVNGEGKLVIGDFGSLKKLTDGWAASRSTNSRLYRPPETCEGLKYHRTGDIYQVGILMYQLLGGHLPYEQSAWLNEKQLSEYEKIRDPIDQQVFANKVLDNRISKAQILDMDSLPPWVPKCLKTIVRTATKQEIDRRYQSCADMLATLSKSRPLVLPWEFVNGYIVLKGPTEFRIVPITNSYAVEKKKRGPWRAVSEAKNLTLAEAIKYIQERSASA